MYAVIRLKGLVKIRKDIKDSFKTLRLNRKMHCVLLREDKVAKGMLQKVKDWSTWGEISDDTLRFLVEKRGRKPGNRRLTKEEAEDIFNKIKENQKVPKEIKPVFRLNPPSKGFKESIKQHYPKGELGYRGKEINELLKRMI
ncbi:MAG: 50S ribosomal protein L30 [Candidatus Aenigmarchaeota archaeon]|nr:50S ribosomal protein L30 [Candidatus Aenigmarchaeota archaeon]